VSTAAAAGSQLNTIRGLQALNTLASPSHPDLATHLRVAAAATSFSKRQGLRLWLEGGLFTHLLDILRALPSLGLSPSLAAEVCAAAAAGVCNVIDVTREYEAALPAAATRSMLMQATQSVEVLSAVVLCGIVPPAAAEQLPPGHKIHLVCGTDARGSGGGAEASTARLLNTPRTSCTRFLQTTQVLQAAFDHPDVLLRLLDDCIFEHMLNMVIQAPLTSKLPRSNLGLSD
jgi:hypothetical protein